ncbi:ATP phosphoribosyltransferase [Sporosarcina trichiuri]|uniref:ATP phosphoribosyltransferase n=1 Tax=Sporosarcina trichiuri TaxID=3056445 RepID=UPI0025B3A93A|nr:ATP phosphoribosyltransferase [Sporosarcina sp. 0.2-SM1T-5]WJY27887.1 ATP phosphoribosyltransferase [Sporosarcina sp. 0.2-SM1T-5]
MAPLKIAVAKGRIADTARELLTEGGIGFPDVLPDERKLIITSSSGTHQLLLVKPADVPTYVEQGAADLGIAGKDTILEECKDVYEVLDLGIGGCRMVVAGFPDSTPDAVQTLKVATKYPNIAGSYFVQEGIRAEISKLHGSIELAPLAGLADVIVDIVETGATLRENGLVVLREIAQVSARVIVNKASFATRTDDVRQCLQLLEKGVGKQHEATDGLAAD